MAEQVVVDFTGPRPIKGTAAAAGFDLYAAEDVVLKFGEQVLVKTGTNVAIPEGYFGMLVARSSLGAKYGVGLANDIGVIDADYRGEIKVALQKRWDNGNQDWIRLGERIAQLVILPVVDVRYRRVPVLDVTVRGEGGFGSTGK